MLHRQHHPNGNPELANQMARFFHLPDKSVIDINQQLCLLKAEVFDFVHSPDKETKFGDFVYLTQAVQAICIQAESEHYRRIKHEKHAYTMGAMYWQLVSLNI